MAVAGTAAMTVIKCVAAGLILASATPNEIFLHLETCSHCATSSTGRGVG